jgi:HEAT repeat protein
MRRRLGRVIAQLGLVVALLIHAAPAHADQVDDLAKMLSSSSEKARLSAAVALARLADKRTLRPLVAALHDPSPKVRMVAAAGLGKLKHRASLPALKNAATDDTDATVRAQCRDAAIEVAKANDMPDELPADAQPVAEKPQARHTKGFGRSPHAVEDRADLYVVIKSSSDDSPGRADKATRKIHADYLKQGLLDSFKSAPQVTMVAADAQRWGLDPRTIDISVTKMDVTSADGFVEVDAELRLAICDDTGKMLSFVSGGAKVQIPSAKFNARFLSNFRKEALDGAMHGLFDKLLDHLRQTTQS